MYVQPHDSLHSADLSALHVDCRLSSALQVPDRHALNKRAASVGLTLLLLVTANLKVLASLQ